MEKPDSQLIDGDPGKRPCGLGPDQPHGEGFDIAGAVFAAVHVLIGSAVVRRLPES